MLEFGPHTGDLPAEPSLEEWTGHSDRGAQQAPARDAQFRGDRPPAVGCRGDPRSQAGRSPTMHHVGLQLRLPGLLAEQAIEVQTPRHRERTAEPPLLPDVEAAGHLQGLRGVRS